MPVATIQSAEARQTKNGKTLYVITLEQNGQTQEVTTWQQAIYDAAKSLEGKQDGADVATSTKQNGQYVNHFLDSCQPHTPPVLAATGGVGGGTVDWDGKDKRIARLASWKVAGQLMAGVTVPAERATPKSVFEMVAPLAHAIELDVYRGYITAEEVPF